MSCSHQSSHSQVAAIIEHGPDGYSAPLTMLVIAATAYGILAGGTSLDDINALRDDMDEDMANSAYGKGVKARNIPLLKMISTVLLTLIGVAELCATFTFATAIGFIPPMFITNRHSWGISSAPAR